MSLQPNVILRYFLHLPSSALKYKSFAIYMCNIFVTKLRSNNNSLYCKHYLSPQCNICNEIVSMKKLHLLASKATKLVKLWLTHAIAIHLSFCIVESCRSKRVLKLFLYLAKQKTIIQTASKDCLQTWSPDQTQRVT